MPSVTLSRCLIVLLLCWTSAVAAHGPGPEFFYALAGVYVLPMIVAVLLAPRGRRWIMAGLAPLSVFVGWLLMYFAFPTGGQANLVIAAIGYLLPWILVPLAGVWRFRHRTI